MTKQSPAVLLIDDDVAILDMIKLMFERKREMTVQTAQSATEALDILTKKTFDVIIVDHAMPVIDGIAFLKILRNQGNATPVIFFTGKGGENTAIKALNYGADYYIKKGDDPRYQFADLAELVKKAARGRRAELAQNVSLRMITSMINFSSEPWFAIDAGDRVVAWNDSMVQLTGVPASFMLGKADGTYAEPFLGSRRKMLVNLIFDTEEEILRQKYMLISSMEDGTKTAATRGKKKDGSEWTLWMKAMPLTDDVGNLVASIGIVRDVSSTFGDVIMHDSILERASELEDLALPEREKPSGLFNKITGKASVYYKQGVLALKEKKYRDAIEAFDNAIAIDKNLAYVWNDRASCFRALDDSPKALDSVKQAVELDPNNPEFLYNLGEILERIGIMKMSNRYLDSAIQTFRKVVILMPNNADSWNHLGICFKEMGNSEESKYYFDRARDIHLWKKDTPILLKHDKYL